MKMLNGDDILVLLKFTQYCSILYTILYGIQNASCYSYSYIKQKQEINLVSILYRVFYSLFPPIPIQHKLEYCTNRLRWTKIFFSKQRSLGKTTAASVALHDVTTETEDSSVELATKHVTILMYEFS